jgi:hypothetical protein
MHKPAPTLDASTTASRNAARSFALAPNGVGSVFYGSRSRFLLVNMPLPPHRDCTRSPRRSHPAKSLIRAQGAALVQPTEPGQPIPAYASLECKRGCRLSAGARVWWSSVAWQARPHAIDRPSGALVTRRSTHPGSRSGVHPIRPFSVPAAMAAMGRTGCCGWTGASCWCGPTADELSCEASGPELMLWTAPPPARRCHDCGRR